MDNHRTIIGNTKEHHMKPSHANHRTLIGTAWARTTLANHMNTIGNHIHAKDIHWGIIRKPWDIVGMS